MMKKEPQVHQQQNHKGGNKQQEKNEKFWKQKGMQTNGNQHTRENLSCQ